MHFTLLCLKKQPCVGHNATGEIARVLCTTHSYPHHVHLFWLYRHSMVSTQQQTRVWVSTTQCVTDCQFGNQVSGMTRRRTLRRISWRPVRHMCLGRWNSLACVMRKRVRNRLGDGSSGCGGLIEAVSILSIHRIPNPLSPLVPVVPLCFVQHSHTRLQLIKCEQHWLY